MVETEGKSPQRLGELLPQVLKSNGIHRRGELMRLGRAWCEAVGPEIARRSRVVSYRGARLTVSVESPAVRQEIEAFLEHSILSRLRQTCPDNRVSALRCIVT